MEVVASLSQGRTAAAQCGLFTHKSVPVIFEPPCICLENGGSKLLRHSVTNCCYPTLRHIPYNITVSSTCCEHIRIDSHV